MSAQPVGDQIVVDLGVTQNMKSLLSIGTAIANQIAMLEDCSRLRCSPCIARDVCLEPQPTAASLKHLFAGTLLKCIAIFSCVISLYRDGSGAVMRVPRAPEKHYCRVMP